MSEREITASDPRAAVSPQAQTPAAAWPAAGAPYDPYRQADRDAINDCQSFRFQPATEIKIPPLPSSAAGLESFRDGPEEAGGASGSIYRHLRLLDGRLLREEAPTE